MAGADGLLMRIFDGSDLAPRSAGTNRLAVVRRALSGYLYHHAALVDELPAHRRPSALAQIEAGTCSDVPSEELCVLSYNIQRGERSAQAADSLRAAVEAHRPHAILLQEAPVEFFRDGPSAELFAGRDLFFAPFHQVDRPDRRYPYRLYGQLTASTCPMRNHHVIELPTVNPSTLGPAHTLKRIALYAEMEAADGRVVGLVNVHNEPFARARDRRLQHEAFLEVIEGRAPAVAVCCGDFNPTFSQRSEPGIRLLEDSGFSNAFARRRTLDTCLARGHAGFADALRLPLTGSDHRPIAVRLRL